MTGLVKPLEGGKAHGDTAANEEFAALSGDKPRVLGKTHSGFCIGRSDDRKVGRRRSKMSIWPLELDWLEKTKREVMIVVPDSFSSVVGHHAL